MVPFIDLRMKFSIERVIVYDVLATSARSACGVESFCVLIRGAVFECTFAMSASSVALAAQHPWGC